MSTLTLNLPESLHTKAKELAEAEHVPGDQFVTLALAEKIAVLTTVDYLEQQGRLGSREAYDRVLAKVAAKDAEPVPADSW